MLTKSDLSAIQKMLDFSRRETKDDLKVLELKMATKEDLERFANKDDLERFATKEDLKVLELKMATKEDLKKFATKEDLKQLSDKFETKFATKEDFRRSISQLVDLITIGFSRTDKAIERLIQHEHRLDKIEDKLFV